jgi:hypothetical protein
MKFLLMFEASIRSRMDNNKSGLCGALCLLILDQRDWLVSIRK